MTNYQRNQLLQLKPWSDEFKSKKKYIEEYLNQKSPATYYKNGAMQCTERRNRSYLDLYFLTKAKFKSTTKAEVAEILFDLCKKPDNSIRSIFCPTICKVVFFSTGVSVFANFLSDEYINEFKEYWAKTASDGVTLPIFIKMVEKRKAKRK